MKNSPYTYTTQAEIRRAFWEAYPELDRRKIKAYSGHGKMYRTDTRVAFCDFLDSLCRDGRISPDLAQRATLSR